MCGQAECSGPQPDGCNVTSGVTVMVERSESASVTQCIGIYSPAADVILAMSLGSFLRMAPSPPWPGLPLSVSARA